MAAAITASDKATIATARERSNAGISAHDAVRATASHMENSKVLASDGALFDGAEAMRSAFTRAFDNPDFRTYVRTPVTINIGGAMAAEHGRWIGRWRLREVRGDYLATWTKADGQWLIRSELFIPLSCAGTGCDSGGDKARPTAGGRKGR